MKQVYVMIHCLQHHQKNHLNYYHVLPIDLIGYLSIDKSMFFYFLFSFISVLVFSQYDQDSSSQIIDEAEWHNETSPGTVHYFRDENGIR
jgi:hypothetical protein